MKGLMNYFPGDTFLHRMDPRSKILFSLLICIACFVTNNLYVLLGILVLDLLIGVCGGIFKQALKLLKGLLKIALFLFILQALVVRTGEPAFYIGKLAITWDGLKTALLGVLRLIDITLPLALMISLTRMSDLSNALVSRWHVPYKYAFAVTSAIRFIPVFTSDLNGIMEAQTARGVEFDTRNFFKKVGLIVPLCVPLLISSVKKIETAAMAVELRGFNLRTKDSSSKVAQFRLPDYLLMLLGLGLIVLAVLL
ncbi:MAG: energy-coupling factor transporter transmembrane protein EcfT [Clostridiales bacterium]|nr:energy-coupling factor transporter transmembrane protein EcfT [Clostridiales bacterium]